MHIKVVAKSFIFLNKLSLLYPIWSVSKEDKWKPVNDYVSETDVFVLQFKGAAT